MTANVRKKRSYKVAAVKRRAGLGKPSEGQRLYSLLTVTAAAGALCGAMTDTACFEGLPTERPTEFLTAFADSLAVILIYIGLCFFAGLSSAGKPVGFLLCFFKGLGAGALTAYIFSRGTADADLRLAADILPFEAAGMALLIYAARENIRMAELTGRRTFGKGGQGISPENGRADLRLYLKKFAVVLLYAIAAAAADGVIAAIEHLF